MSREPPRGSPSESGLREVWKLATLESHNKMRKHHQAEPLTWSDECYLAAKAQADACQAHGSMFNGMVAGKSGTHGQNVYWSSQLGSTPEEVVRAWYNEVNNPGYPWQWTEGHIPRNMMPTKKVRKMRHFDCPHTSHFTQVVWAATTQVGMAASEDGRFIVANYFPAGSPIPSRRDDKVTAQSYVMNVRPAAQSGAPMEEYAEQNQSAGPAAVVVGTLCKAPYSLQPAPSQLSGVRPVGASETACSSSAGVTASKLTPELEELLVGCPYPYKERITAAFAREGGAVVNIVRTGAGTSESLAEIAITVRDSMESHRGSRLVGSWGAG